jgi:hypothetical protein
LGDYNALPNKLYVDFRAIDPPNGDEQSVTTLYLLDLNIVSGNYNPSAQVNIKYWNEWEKPFSGSTAFQCWYKTELDDLPSGGSGFERLNLGSYHGSMKINSTFSGLTGVDYPDDNPNHRAGLLGALVERGSGSETPTRDVNSGSTQRTLFHTGSYPSIYYPSHD